VKLRSSNDNNSIVLNTDYDFLEFETNEDLKTSDFQCYLFSFNSTISNSCSDPTVHSFGDDDINTQVILKK